MHNLNTSMYISHFSQCMKMHKNEKISWLNYINITV